MWIGLIIATAVLLGATASDDKIVGGDYVRSILDHPYMVEISHEDDHLCGGGIIQPKWILTACHCMGEFSEITGQLQLPDKASMEAFEVTAGSVFIRSPKQKTAQIRKVKTMLRHPECLNMGSGKVEKVIHDIGAMEVDEKFKFNAFVRPMNFFDIDPVKYEDRTASLRTNPKVSCSLSGWGGLSHQEPYSNQMKKLQVAFVSDKDCLSANEGNRHYRNFNFTKWKQFCVKSVASNEEGPFKGDSGAPLICNDFVVGVFSSHDYKEGTFIPSIIQSVSVMMDVFERWNILCDEPGGCRSLDSTTPKSASEKFTSHAATPSGDSVLLLTRTNIYVLISVIIAVSL